MGPRRWWPFLVLLVANCSASMNVPVLERCTGWSLEGGRRAGAAVRALLAYPCSPYFLSDSWLDWLLLAAMWAPIPFAFLSWRWAQRHRAYWNTIRQREKVRRAEKRAQKATSKVP